jgi:phosphoglycerate dehydrogenase-like enzyme
MRVREVMGTRWLVIGFGAIGAGVGRIARAFGAHVTGVRRTQRDDPDADAIASLADVPSLLPQADVVVLTCPLTAETRNLAGAEFFARMKRGSVLVNIGRGGLVDEEALLSALPREAPAHAVLDVFQTEPLPAESPFWDHPQVFVTPHNSGVTDGQAARIDAAFVENLGRYVRGEPLLHEERPEDVLAGEG